MHRAQLIAAYLDYLNNFITVEVFAKHYGYNYSEATELLKIAKQVFRTLHPEA